MLPSALVFSKEPFTSLGVKSIRSKPRSSAAKPRVTGVAASDKLLMGAINSSIAVTKATKPPTVVVFSALCIKAIEMTADSAMAASTWVMALIPA